MENQPQYIEAHFMPTKPRNTPPPQIPELKLVFTRDVPTEPGFYYWTNFGEHTPTVLEVTKDYSTGALYAQNEEYSFPIKKERATKTNKEMGVTETDGNDKYYYGDSLWCRIPDPWLPSGNKQITPNCY